MHSQLGLGQFARWPQCRCLNRITRGVAVGNFVASRAHPGPCPARSQRTLGPGIGWDGPALRCSCGGRGGRRGAVCSGFGQCKWRGGCCGWRRFWCWFWSRCELPARSSHGHVSGHPFALAGRRLCLGYRRVAGAVHAGSASRGGACPGALWHRREWRRAGPAEWGGSGSSGGGGTSHGAASVAARVVVRCGAG